MYQVTQSQPYILCRLLNMSRKGKHLSRILLRPHPMIQHSDDDKLTSLPINMPLAAAALSTTIVPTETVSRFLVEYDSDLSTSAI